MGFVPLFAFEYEKLNCEEEMEAQNELMSVYMISQLIRMSDSPLVRLQLCLMDLK